VRTFAKQRTVTESHRTMEASSLPHTMLACQVVKFNEPYVVHEVPVPQTLEPYELLLKVAAASLCHTDSMVQAGLFPGIKPPVTASHEGVGVCVATGSAVQDFKINDRVLAGIPRNRCGQCEDCTSTSPQYCQFREGAIGIQVDGAFAEYMVCDSRNACHIPDGVDFVSAAPLACAGITVFRALEETHLADGQWLGIVGSGGGLGHLGIAFAKAKGLRVIGVDARDEGLALSRDFGADLVLDARHGDDAVVKQVHEATHGKGVDAAMNLSEASTAAGLACAITRKHGYMVQVAQPQQVVIPFRELIFRDIHISGTLAASPSQAEEMLQFVAKHRIPVKTNVYYGLNEIPKLVEEAHSGKMQGKGVISLAHNH